VLLDDVHGFFAAFQDGGDGVFEGWNLGGEEFRSDKRGVAENCKDS
jgi:hypothetical protein